MQALIALGLTAVRVRRAWWFGAAVAIGYADLVAIGGSVLNQTGQSIEVVLIWMVVYLGISLITSLGMNEFNRRMALVER